MVTTNREAWELITADEVAILVAQGGIAGIPPFVLRRHLLAVGQILRVETVGDRDPQRAMRLERGGADRLAS